MPLEINQPLVNIGLLGHVANGKSSLVRTITGEKTSRNDSRCVQKQEKREMTIQLGYSNAKIYQCKNCPKPDCYYSVEGSSKCVPECTMCHTDSEMELVQFVSFVDCPGHRQLMQNMISGSVVMDSAILVVDSTETQIQIQTEEHLIAAEIVGLNHYIAIAQNKIDLVAKEEKGIEKLYDRIDVVKNLVNGTAADLAITPVIPTSFSPGRSINLKLLLQQIVERAAPNHHPAYKKYPVFIHCIRSFDVNKPGPLKKLVGGVIGGTIMHGKIQIGDTIEIRPGRKCSDGSFKPILTTITSLHSGKTKLTIAYPGGLIGIGTTMEPSLTRGDAMVGMCAGQPGTLPDPVTQIQLKFQMLNKTIGADSETQMEKVRLGVGQVIQLAFGSSTVRGKLVEKVGRKCFEILLEKPVCPVDGQSIPVSKSIDGNWSIIGRAFTTCSEEYNHTRPPTTSHISYDDAYKLAIEQLPVVSGNSRVHVPIPELKKEGSTRLVWLNVLKTSEVLHRKLTEIQAFFQEELNTRITVNEQKQLIIRGKNRFTVANIQSILKKYIRLFVVCNTCKSLDTELTKDGNIHRFVCNYCGAEHLR